MTQLRKLSNGTIISREQSQLSPNHHVYYVEGGSEGHVLVVDTYLVDLSILMACAAWELDVPPFQYPTPTIEFNKK